MRETLWARLTCGWALVSGVASSLGSCGILKALLVLSESNFLFKRFRIGSRWTIIKTWVCRYGSTNF